MVFDNPLVPYVRFPAEMPPLPIRRPDDPGEPTYVVRAAISREGAAGVILTGQTQTGEAVRIAVSMVAPGVARILLETGDPAPGRVTLAHLPETPPPVTVARQPGGVTLTGADLRVEIALDPFHIAFYGADGRALLSQEYNDRDVTDRLTGLPFGFSVVDGRRVAFHDTFTAEPDEHFYGFGEKFTEFDKRGQRLAMWNYDAFGVHSERAYKNVPFFLSTRRYGMFVDSVTPIRFDMAASSHSVFSVIVPDAALDYYVISGPDLKTIITRYAGLVSLPILPPKWAFGLWMSSGFKADSADDVLRRARELRAREVPCDVLHLDCYWQRFGCWSDMVWDTAMFPDPEGLIRQLRQDGYRVCLWMNPYLGIQSERFAEAEAKGYLLKTRDGRAWVGDLWSGSHPPVGIIDMTNPEAVAWFKELLRPHLRMGVDVFKTDFGEGVPADVVAHNGMSGETLHNLYPLLYNDAVAEVTAEETGHAGLVWGRSTYAGGQRHAAQWGGDPDCTYPALASTLRGGLSLGLCGHAFWSHDIGGFHKQPTPDLYVRWAQFGLFSPLARAHGMTTRLPWDYGEQAEAIFRRYVALRYRLLPYIYSYAALAAETSLPLVRPLVLEFPDDPLTYALDLQYCFGAELMVAPITNREGRRPVYFPAGRWVDFWTHEVIAGPATRTVEAPLEILPLYVRANALIPTVEPALSLSDEPFPVVTFDAYLLEAGAFDLRDTDGLTRLAAAFDGNRLNVTLHSPKAAVLLRVLPLAGAPQVEAVTVNGQALARAERVAAAPGAAPCWARGADGVTLCLLQNRL